MQEAEARQAALTEELRALQLQEADKREQLEHMDAALLRLQVCTDMCEIYSQALLHAAAEQPLLLTCLRCSASKPLHARTGRRGLLASSFRPDSKAGSLATCTPPVP